MRIAQILMVVSLLVTAGALALGVAVLAADRIEDESRREVEAELALAGLDWAHVRVDGLIVRITGVAPDEATRFRAITVAGNVVDPARIVDAVAVRPAADVAPPRFSIEILRNSEGISLIGLVPDSMDRAEVLSRLRGVAGSAPVADLLDSADYPVPPTWAAAVRFGLDALARLPRSKISVAADRVAITAIAASAEERRLLEGELRKAVPPGVALDLDIAAPRPVVAPFTLRFLIDAEGARFDACTAHDEKGRERILAAARAAGLLGEARCTLGLGVPSPRWAEAVEMAIAALARLGSGSVTFSDGDVTLIAGAGVARELFETVAGELESSLPPAFTLHATLPEPNDAATGPAAEDLPQFLATLSPEGLLQLRGRVPDVRIRDAVVGFARARFAGADVHGALRVDRALPEGWPQRVLAALESLGHLSHGVATVQPGRVEIRGTTAEENARAEIARLLSARLGESADFRIDVTYVPPPDPADALPTPQDCVDRINAILADAKITFAPGSARITAEAGETLDRIAAVMRECTHVPMEIGGHTDSQGREAMNERLSQERAEAVLNALLARRVDTRNLTARGYGESQPIADNATEEGREANRRIEFRLVETDVAGPESAGPETIDPETAGPETAKGEAPAAEDGDAGAVPQPVPRPVVDPDAAGPGVAAADTEAGAGGSGEEGAPAQTPAAREEGANQ